MNSCASRRITFWRDACPTPAVGTQTAARDHTMQMRVMQQILAPGMQDGDEADLGAQVLRVGGDGAQGLGGGMEQDVVDDRLVLVRDRSDLLRHREDDVKVFDRQQFGLPVFQPLSARQRLALWTMAVAAAVEGDALMAAGVALLDVATECGRAAALDGAHDAALAAAQALAVLLAVGGAELAEDVRHLEPDGAQRDPQKWAGGLWFGGASTLGSRSNGLTVAHTVLVATFR